MTWLYITQHKPPFVRPVLFSVERKCGKRYVVPGYLKSEDKYVRLNGQEINDTVYAWAEYPKPAIEYL